MRGGYPNDDIPNKGRDLIEQVFSSFYMAEIIVVIKKFSKVQNEISQTIEKYNKESYATQAKIGQNALIQSKDFEQAVNIMGDTIEDMDIEIEQKKKQDS